MNRKRGIPKQLKATDISRAIYNPPLLTSLTISDPKEAATRNAQVCQEYSFVDPLPDKYLCGICKSVLAEPHATECCGQHFCKECLGKSKKESTHCPTCRQNNFNHMKYLPIEREINDLKVSCPRQSSGCNAQVNYADKKNHDKECEFVLVPCTNKCKQLISKKDMESHIKNHCELRETTCKTCGKVGEYKEIESLAHYLGCPDAIQRCPYKSCTEQFKRKDAESHISICPEAIVTCDFVEAGCLVALIRKDLDSHMETNMKKHLSLLMKAHLAMKQENAAIKQQNTAMKHENAAIRKEIKELKRKTVDYKTTQKQDKDKVSGKQKTLQKF